MKTIVPAAATLLIIDVQEGLMPAIDRADAAIANIRQLIDAARPGRISILP